MGIYYTITKSFKPEEQLRHFRMREVQVLAAQLQQVKLQQVKALCFQGLRVRPQPCKCVAPHRQPKQVKREMIAP